jgi:FkbM family methyltransferase
MKSTTFWGKSISVFLPSSIDIYLAGGKTHDSEIRLGQFLILNIDEKDMFLDVGAHIGYFSLLVSQLSSNIKVISIEASKKTFNLLEKNTASSPNIFILNMALSDKIGKTTFFEFPPLYDEYNTIVKSQYVHQKWFMKYSNNFYDVETLTGDKLNHDLNFIPAYIKIDVEGAEFMVIKGLENTLRQNSITLIMEFAKDSKINERYILADQLIKSLGYVAFKINDLGVLIPLKTATINYINSLKVQSDNIVYRKAT